MRLIRDKSRLCLAQVIYIRILNNWKTEFNNFSSFDFRVKMLRRSRFIRGFAVSSRNPINNFCTLVFKPISTHFLFHDPNSKKVKSKFISTEKCNHLMQIKCDSEGGGEWTIVLPLEILNYICVNIFFSNFSKSIYHDMTWHGELWMNRSTTLITPVFSELIFKKQLYITIKVAGNSYLKASFESNCSARK